jgi:hypothetical protein
MWQARGPSQFAAGVLAIEAVAKSTKPTALQPPQPCPFWNFATASRYSFRGSFLSPIELRRSHFPIAT